MPEIDPDRPFPIPFPLPGNRPRLPIPLPLPDFDLPFPNPFPPSDGGAMAGAPPGFHEALGLAAYSALRLGDIVLVRARGQLSSASQIADLRVDSRLIHPLQLRFVVYTPNFAGIAVIRDFDFVERFGFPATAPSIVIHDVNGAHQVPIADIAPAGGQALLAANSADKATGFGSSLQEAFDNAVKALPAGTDVADDLLTYRIVESGFLRGGFPGFSQHYAIVELHSSFAAAAPPGGAQA